MKRYNPKDIEPKWQKYWADNGIYKTDLNSSKPKYVGFAMFNYPSGAGIHVGHAKNFTLPDIMTRAKRQQGFESFSPTGFDSFGLPAENYAIKTGVPPRETTDKAISTYRRQYDAMGWAYDWDKVIDTSDPKYYRWTQWIFTKLFEQGLAYQKENPQWWCDIDKTVLADEQVVDGKCWRHDGPDDPVVVKKALKQWFFKITDYVDDILAATDELDWTESIKTQQKNWIGRKSGIDITYQITNAGKPASVVTFTTHPDTNFGATFIVIAPEHPLVQQIIDKQLAPEGIEDYSEHVAQYKQQAMAKSEVERQEEGRKKTGVFTGLYAKNTLNDQDMPIWVSDFVLMGFGTGAVVGVPAHDLRDFQFAKAFDIPIVEVIEPVTGTPQDNPEFRRSTVSIVRNPKTNQFLSINWGKQNGGYLFIGGGREQDEDIVQTAMREVAEETGYKNLKLVSQTGKIHHHYFAHSKGVARQIEAHGLLFDLVDEERADQDLEPDEEGKFSVEWISGKEVDTKVTEELHRLVYDTLVGESCYTGEGIMINSGKYTGLPSYEARERISDDLVEQGKAEWRVNYKIRDWLISRQRYWGAPIPIIHCPDHGAVAVPEKDLPVVLPEVKSWEPSGDGKSVLARAEEWVKTTCPTCGKPSLRETDIMDGYACSSWYFLRYLDSNNDQQAWSPELAKKWMPVDFYNGGDHAIAHLIYARFWMRFFYKLGLVSTPEPFKRMYFHAKILAPDGSAFSKSKGNGIDPLDIIESGYGADALRTYIVFMAPADMIAPWNEGGVPGTFRFLRRVWDFVQEFVENESSLTNGVQDKQLITITHKTIKKVTHDIQEVKFNTAIAAMMEMVNYLYKIKSNRVNSKDMRFTLESLVQLLAPFAPHIAEELWHDLGHKDSVHVDHWPRWEESCLTADKVVVVVQINGKVRAQLEMDAQIEEQAALAAAKADQRVAGYLDGKEIAKEIYVPGKLISFALK